MFECRFRLILVLTLGEIYLRVLHGSSVMPVCSVACMYMYVINNSNSPVLFATFLSRLTFRWECTPTDRRMRTNVDSVSSNHLPLSFALKLRSRPLTHEPFLFFICLFVYFFLRFYSVIPRSHSPLPSIIVVCLLFMLPSPKFYSSPFTTFKPIIHTLFRRGKRMADI